MKYANVVNLVFNQPWALLPSKYQEIQALIAFKAEGGEFTPEEIQAAIGAATPGQARRNGAVAVLPLFGVMGQRMNMLEAMSGGVSTEQFGKAFQAAVVDPAIGGIVIDIDSPGGSTAGVQELWQIVMNARGQKPIIAFANSMAASAAYWVATAADEIVVTPGGQVGSIGIFTGHADLSARMEMEGENITLVSAGRKKLDRAPTGPLSEEAKADLQADVDTLYAMFVGSVAKGRGVTGSAVRSGFGEGGMVFADEAVKLGMADRVGTLETALARAGGRGGFKAGSGFHQVAAVGETTAEGTTVATSVDGILWTDSDGGIQAPMDAASDDGDAELRERRLALQERIAGG